MINFSRKAVLLFLLFVLFLTGCGNRKEEKVYRVGILSGINYFLSTIDSFKEKMAELGYVEGENIIYDIQKTNFRPKEENLILEKWVAENVDLIFATPSEVALAAKNITHGTKIPVLFANVYIEGFDLIDDVISPGGNITGVRYPHSDLAVKSLETLLEIVPQAERIWLPYRKGYPSVFSQLEKLRKAATEYGITLVEFPAENAADIEAELNRLNEHDNPCIDAIMHMADPAAAWAAASRAISEFVEKHKLAYHGLGGKCVFMLTIDSIETGKLAAPMADKILKGAPAGSIPVVTADAVLTINYNVALELGLTIPESLLARADYIIR